MSYLTEVSEDEVRRFHTDLHARWQTPECILKPLLDQWGYEDSVIGDRIVAGESSEVYKLYEGSTGDLLGYLRIAHHELNYAEVVLMEECEEVGLPSVQVLRYGAYDCVQNGSNNRISITLLSPAKGINIEEGLDTGELESEVAQKAISNAGIELARIHRLSETSNSIADLVEREQDIFSRRKPSDYWSECLKGLEDIPGLEEFLQRVARNIEMLDVKFGEIIDNHPLVLTHADYDMKHLYCDPQTGEITSIIDFGEAHVSVSHADLVHWNTYSTESYPFFLEGYLGERFSVGSMYEGIFLNGLDAAFAERVFLDELDVVFAVGQLKWAAGRVENGINAEAIHHLMKCVETCEGLSVGYPNLAVISLKNYQAIGSDTTFRTNLYL